jgi:nucleotidyltransferase substrate binding protein (TIGR01987 family)
VETGLRCSDQYQADKGGFNVLDLTGFRKAISAMERTLAYGETLMHKDGAGSEIEKEVLTAAVVQHFEVTYELCWKYMRRWLEANLSPGVTAGFSRKQLFRLAAEQLLIDCVEDWFTYHELRNLTAHTHNSETAAEIIKAAPGFCIHAKNLFSALESRND